MLLLLIAVRIAFVQVEISETITDAVEGKAIAGATITVVSRSAGIFSDEQGKNSLTVPDQESAIVVSYFGFAKQEMYSTRSHRWRTNQ